MHTSGVFEHVTWNNIDSYQTCYTELLHIVLEEGLGRELNIAYSILALVHYLIS